MGVTFTLGTNGVCNGCKAVFTFSSDLKPCSATLSAGTCTAISGSTVTCTFTSDIAAAGTFKLTLNDVFINRDVGADTPNL